MSVRIVFQQMMRNRGRTLWSVVLLAAVTVFFTMGLNLYWNSIDNLKRVEEAYTTIALMELYGSVDQYGQLVSPEDVTYEGYYPVGVKGYDLSEIIAADNVIKYDLRSRYAAYIEGGAARDDNDRMVCSNDLIRFTLADSEPVELPIYSAGGVDFELTTVKLNILDSAAGIYKYSDTFQLYFSLRDEEHRYYEEALRRLNGQDVTDRVILYPGVEYYIGISTGTGWQLDVNGTYVNSSQMITNMADSYGKDYYVSYFMGFENTATYPVSEEHPQPFVIQRWEEVKSDPEMLAYYEQAAQALRYTLSSFPVTLTNDIMGIPSFHFGGAQLLDGRFITDEDYAAGEKVCMISQKLAMMQNWQVGDKLDMNLYTFEAFVGAEVDVNCYPRYHQNTGDFFAQEQFEIVGIFSSREVQGNSTISESSITVPWNTIYIPRKALETPHTLEELPVHGNLLTLWLKNGTMEEFLNHVDTLGITKDRPGEYTAKFTFYDQGYSIIQPSLRAMMGTAKLLLILSSILFVITTVLLAWFFAQSQKQNAGILRMLGGKKRQILTAVLLCAFLIAGIGAAAGTCLGVKLTRTLGDRLLQENLKTNEENADFRAYVLAEEGGAAYTITAGVNPQLTAVTGAAGVIFCLMLVFSFMLLYLSKEPRELLPKAKL